jgi:hypothetical protein
MRSPHVAGLLSLLAVTFVLPCAWADEVSFRIRDRLAVDEVAEVTTLYIDGTLVRSFRLDRNERDVTIPITVPDDRTAHHYALCGHIVVRDPDGQVRTKSFGVGGAIADVAGREFEAYASDNFTRFFLVDTTPGKRPTEIDPQETNVCTPAVS